MIRIGNSPFSADPASTSAKGSPVSSGDSEVVQVADQVQLSQLTATVLQGRLDHIEALKTIVASPDYFPPSAPVSQKLIEAGLSRVA